MENNNFDMIKMISYGKVMLESKNCSAKMIFDNICQIFVTNDIYTKILIQEVIYLNVNFGRLRCLSSVNTILNTCSRTRI